MPIIKIKKGLFSNTFRLEEGYAIPERYRKKIKPITKKKFKKYLKVKKSPYGDI